MGARIIDGKAIAAELRAQVAAQVKSLADTHALVPRLAVVLVGTQAASETYVRSKTKAIVEVGMRTVDQRLPASVSEAELFALVRALNADATVHGILVQLPLPPHIDALTVVAALDPDKDVDGFSPVNIGRLATGIPGFAPCTPLGCIRLAKSVHASLEGLEAVVIGRSNVVGKPLAQLLLGQNATVTIAHSKSRNLPAVCARADLLFAATGQPQIVKRDWIKPGATVIDVGINRVVGTGGDARLVGDVAFAEVAEVAGAITPVPGGVGPMTIACLLANTLWAACLNAGVPVPE
jgi:methylenetetrahydrofolate dehydrogenase (NADP+)/methenyltetrahydrofolate cyclohydrolase